MIVGSSPHVDSGIGDIQTKLCTGREMVVLLDSIIAFFLYTPQAFLYRKILANNIEQPFTTYFVLREYRLECVAQGSTLL